MPEIIWEKHCFKVPDLELTFYTAGAGETLVLLAGGPGDSSEYMQEPHEILTQHFKCVAFDQRGTGKSILEVQSPELLNAMKVVDDLEALRLHLKLEKLNLLGLSWGANLAMLYASLYPTRAGKVAAIAPGPMNLLMSAVASANLIRGFSSEDLLAHPNSRAARQLAFEANDIATLRALQHQSTVSTWTRGAIYSQVARAKFNAEYNTDNFNPFANRFTWQSYKALGAETLLSSITAQLLVLYGFQDFGPITQAYLIREKVSHAKLEFINNCGHIPWLEQPAAYYDVLTTFLNS